MATIAGACISIALMLIFVQMRLYDIREELREMNRLKRRELDGGNTDKAH